ncbi:uncharacterized protein Dana_GF21280 [Drosophila ananassae]|uniref:BACK domain-containing protein n=1 Tax=Drosophila ananassae TaxID=7217 RepID=B3MRH0_DROAN|nr:uncharacterized protein LOC6503964 [Drosophila ananassae]EDV34375.1 uncharacterized protein Dana_GF21280 [Drosophila ananassae]
MSDSETTARAESSDTTLVSSKENINASEIPETENIGDGASKPGASEAKSSSSDNVSEYSLESNQTITGDAGTQEDDPSSCPPSSSSSDAYTACNTAAFHWRTFTDNDYADWNTIKQLNKRVPFISFFSILKVKQCPTTVGDQQSKPTLQKLVEERVACNLCATTRIWVGDFDHFDCIPSLLKCYSVWFATRDWRLQEFEFEPNDVPAVGFEMLYKWMRTTEIPELENIVPTLQAAKHLKVSLLETELWKRVSHDSVREKLAFRCYVQAQKLPELAELREIMLSRIRNYFLPMVGSQHFLDLDVDALEQLLLRDTLGVNSEMEIFFAVLRWVGHCPELVHKRLPHMQRLMDCVRFHYVPMTFLFSLRESCTRTDKREIFRPDPVLLALNTDPRTMSRMEDAMAFIGTRCQYNTDEFVLMCSRKALELVYPRLWQYHPKCSYHAPKLVFPYKHKFTATDFSEYIASLQEAWSGDGPEDWGKSQMEDLEPDILISIRDGKKTAKSDEVRSATPTPSSARRRK